MTSSSFWIPVGQLEEAFSQDSYALPPTTDFAGKTLTLYFENTQVIQYRFETENRLVWNLTTGSGSEAEETYFAAKMREGIYYVDFVNRLERASTVTLVLDLNRGIFTALLSQLPSEPEARQDILSRVIAGGELTRVTATFLHGSINTSFNPETPRHEVTGEMIGQRAEYTYSPTERYEHVYLNEKFYSWHCLLGVEKGLADTDRCHYYKLAEQLYLFVWREKIIPTLGAVIVDWSAMRSSGKIFGYEENDFAKLVNFRVGSKARFVNR